MIRHNSAPAFIRHCILEFLNRTDTSHIGEKFVEGLRNGQMDYKFKEAPEGWSDTHRLTFWIPLDNYDGEAEEAASKMIAYAFRKMHEAEHTGDVTVLFRVVPGSIPSTETGLNQVSFKTEQTIPHDGLRFRSRAEIAIYDALKKRNVLFFPNSAAILGRQPPEGYELREPDFLICHRGKWGLLEVSGEPWHSGAISTAKDHDRSRLFQRYGLVCVQHFDSNRCRHSPDDVVEEFLLLLSKT